MKQKGHWVRVYEGRDEKVALRKVAELHSMGRKAKLTRKRLGIGWWRTVWKWVN